LPLRGNYKTRSTPPRLRGEKSEAGRKTIKPDHASGDDAFFSGYPSQYLITSNLAIGVHPGISASDEVLTPFPDNSVGLEFRALSKQHDVADSQRARGDWFDAHNFPILNCRQHASTYGPKA
jgi:hypothetical protein